MAQLIGTATERKTIKITEWSTMLNIFNTNSNFFNHIIFSVRLLFIYTARSINKTASTGLVKILIGWWGHIHSIHKRWMCGHELLIVPLLDLTFGINNTGHFYMNRFSWFQQEGAPPHYLWCDLEFLDITFPNCWIGRGEANEWPARSPNLIPLDDFFMELLKKHSVCELATYYPKTELKGT